MQICILVVHPVSLRKKCDFYPLYQRYIYVSVCIYVYMCVCVYIYIYIYIYERYTHTHTHTNTHTSYYQALQERNKGKKKHLSRQPAHPVPSFVLRQFLPLLKVLMSHRGFASIVLCSY